MDIEALSQKLCRLRSSSIDLRRLLTRLFIFIIFSILILTAVQYHRAGAIFSYIDKDDRPFEITEFDLDSVNRTISRYEKQPISPPFKTQFWEVGQRLRQLTGWVDHADQLNSKAPIRQHLEQAVESLSSDLFPFLSKNSSTPFADLRSSFEAGSKGIVIPVGGATALRFASHLIVSLRTVLKSELPIEVVYAGESDLSTTDRESMMGLEGATNITFTDIFSIVDDSTLKLADGGWAIKAFAALTSSFEHVILMDADAIFLRKPEALFDQQVYQEHGALLYHDRLLWQHAFRERHNWIEDQIKEPSPAMNKSLVWTEDYAEECDSGVVVLNKSRTEVLAGLLHTAWQNTQEVRDEVTYKLMYGDKESWWMGLELAGSGYGFEANYASIMGWQDECGDKKEECVCSFTISHIDDEGKLIWFNGSLLKNKHIDAKTFALPEAWMTNGKWRKGASKADMSCMVNAPISPLQDSELGILKRSIEAAKRADKSLGV
ncbi:hypothetical protein CC79DRAFT_1338298 [Sarocladium strictum]